MSGRPILVANGRSSNVPSLAWTAHRRAASFGFLRLATLFLAQALDLATFSVMVARHGAAAEGNPLVSNLFDTFGFPAVAFAKLALIVMIGALCIAASSRGSRGIWSMVGGLPLALAIAAGIIGGITNAAVLLGYAPRADGGSAAVHRSSHSSTVSCQSTEFSGLRTQ